MAGNGNVDDLAREILGTSKYKLVFLGDICVGKTSIINWFLYEKFDVGYQATIGIDFVSKRLEIDDRTVRL
jgi:Ras-related protein Rab-6A